MKKVIGLMLLITVIVAILPGTVGAAPPAATGAVSDSGRPSVTWLASSAS